jgi:hypothetical protein
MIVRDAQINTHIFAVHGLEILPKFEDKYLSEMFLAKYTDIHKIDPCSASGSELFSATSVKLMIICVLLLAFSFRRSNSFALFWMGSGAILELESASGTSVGIRQDPLLRF